MTINKKDTLRLIKEYRKRIDFNQATEETANQLLKLLNKEPFMPKPSNPISSDIFTKKLAKKFEKSYKTIKHENNDNK